MANFTEFADTVQNGLSETARPAQDFLFFRSMKDVIWRRRSKNESRAREDLYVLVQPSILIK